MTNPLRVLRALRGESSVALVLANLLPIAGVLFLGWNLKTLVMAYWIENGIVGVLTIAKMILARERGGLGKSKGYQIIFFVAHYATFWVMHGVLIINVLLPPSYPYEGSVILFALSALVFIASHGVSFKFNFWDRREYERVDSVTLMVLPYVRVLPAHIVLLAAILFVRNLDGPYMVLVAVAVLKTVIDALVHLYEHAWIARRPAPLRENQSAASTVYE